jgi:purine nucleosidase
VAVRVILDTDIGTDVDDCLALTVLLTAPEVQLDAVTGVYGDVHLRGRMVKKLLRLAGRDDVPVMAGATQTIMGVRPIFWQGHEGTGLLEPGDLEDSSLAPNAEHAVDYLVRTVMANPGQIHLVAVGPLTNVALAIRREPTLVNALASLTIMGGAIRGVNDLHLPLAEHNIISDPEAAFIVLSQPRLKTLVPLDVTTKVELRPSDVERIRAAGTPFHDAIATQVELYPRFVERGGTYLHDPLAAAILIEPTLTHNAELHLDVETQGTFGAGVTFARQPAPDLPANASVALGVDVERAERFIVDRLASPITQPNSATPRVGGRY